VKCLIYVSGSNLFYVSLIDIVFCIECGLGKRSDGVWGVMTAERGRGMGEISIDSMRTVEIQASGVN
jgi:hypothetical protein